MKVTIVDIANKLEITPSTVSRALADNPRVSLKTRELVKKTATEMGYQPNQMASSLRKGTSDTIGMIVPRINRHFFSNVICGVEEILNEAGYNLTVIQTSEKISKEIQAIDTLRKGRVAGIIISLSLETNEYEHLTSLENQLPLVQFDRVCFDIQGPKVINDNYGGSYKATQSLIEKGYKRFIHFTGSAYNIVYQERKRGFLEALEHANIPASEYIVFESELTRLYGRSLIQTLWEKESFDAIVSASDYLALGAIEGLTEIGVSVPNDVGVVGFANEPFAELMHPSLSTIEQHGEQMGREAAQAILKKIKGTAIEDIAHIPVQLIERKSTDRNG